MGTIRTSWTAYAHRHTHMPPRGRAMRSCRREDASHIEAFPPLVDGILAGARSCRGRALATHTRTNIEQCMEVSMSS